MNNKHLACILIGLVILGAFFGVSKINQNLTNVRKQYQDQKAKAEQLSRTLTTERAVVTEFRQQSQEMREFLNTWEPYFEPLRTAQSSELNLNARIKEANLVSLSQRFELVKSTDNDAIPQTMRAHLTFEDDYARLLNWIGQLETQIPVMRVSSLNMTRGESGSDLRMELVLDLPLIKDR